MTRTGVAAALALPLVAALGATALVVWLNLRGEDPLVADTAGAPSAELIARGAYLARAGNCRGCHTDRGGAAYAGGRGVPTPFGTVYAPNLTPDRATGIGAWTAAEFWRALHNGRSRDGRLLYPAFPYLNYTRIARADSDAIHTYLRSLPAVAQANRRHSLKFPYDQPAALALWRALYFRPAQIETDPARSADWNRGAYLVEALGHCNACHARRNALGAASSPLDLEGGLIPVQNWYAPSLTAADEAGVADWDLQDIVDLLRTGVSARGAVSGPMGEVVGGSTQFLTESDLRAMAGYLKALPPTAPEQRRGATTPDPAPDTPGAKLYAQHCAQCHGEQGEGVAGMYPELAGSRAVTMRSSANLVHIVIEGGFPPSTAGNPRPFGMPPFATVLSADEVAQVLSHLRTSWGNRAAPVTTLEVTQIRDAR
ncbi:MAG: cytochrome c [Burkholderiaceae bacterium]